jgi:hypothetical protein
MQGPLPNQQHAHSRKCQNERFCAICLNAKSSEERVVYKRLNSMGTLIQRTTTEAPQWIQSTLR